MRLLFVLTALLMFIPIGCNREETASAPPAAEKEQTTAVAQSSAALERSDPEQAAAESSNNDGEKPATQPATQPAHPKPEGADAAPERLYGTWVATNVDSKVGQVKIELTFKKEGPVHLLAWSELPLVGQVRNKTAPYEVTNGKLHSDALRGGTTVDYWFEGDALMVEYKPGQIVRFTKSQDAP